MLKTKTRIRAVISIYWLVHYASNLKPLEAVASIVILANIDSVYEWCSNGVAYFD